jgi:hypothetical protein
LFYKAIDLAPGFIEIRKLRKGVHGKLDTLDLGWSDPLDFGLWYPGCADGPAGPIFVNDSIGGDAVPDRELERVAILQISNPGVPIVAVEALQIRA